MDRIRWSEKSIQFRNLVDNPAIQKPTLVQIGTKSFIVGEKITGEFIVASPCKILNKRIDVLEQEILLSSKHTGLWKVISKSSSKDDSYIHRLSTKDIERIFRKDIENERTTPRSYICTKDIEAFEINLRPNDEAILNGQRADRRKKHIEENVEFEVTDIGEAEYTPTEGERTSQDYVEAPKSMSEAFLQLFISNNQDTEQLIRNRVLRTLYCTTKNEAHKRNFFLEVNAQPCDIRPIASEGSIELRYLHSTQNLLNYMLMSENNVILYVKLLRGNLPIKAIEYDGYMVFRSVLTGDKIPICRMDNLEVIIVNPDLPNKVHLPRDDRTWHSLPEIRTAELQCMQLNLALLSKHESEIYVRTNVDKTTINYLESYPNQEERLPNSRRSSDTTKKNVEESEENFNKQISLSKRHNDESSSGKTKSVKDLTTDERRIIKEQTPKVMRSSPLSHPVSDKLYRDDEKRVLKPPSKTDKQRGMEEKEKFHLTQQTTSRSKPMTLSSSSTSFNISKTKTNF